MTLSLEDIQALSEEIRHLVEAGLPLENALADAGAGRGERLKAVAREISAELAQGRSLDDVVARQSIGAPRMLAAAVGAGIQTGNLNLAVELMGDFAADLIELRTRLLQAAAYPLMIVTIASLLLMGVVQHALTELLTMIQDWQLPVNSVVVTLLSWNATAPWWTFIVPVAGIALLVVWTASGRASAMSFKGPERLLLLLPGVGALVRDLRYYTLSRMLSLLTEHGLALPAALSLSGGASGSPRLDQACQSLSAKLQRGESVTGKISALGEQSAVAGLPPLLHVCLTQTGQSEQRMIHRLRSVASFYRSRLERNATWIRLLLPVVLFVIVGGGTVLLYCGLVFWPVSEIYQHLGQ